MKFAYRILLSNRWQIPWNSKPSTCTFPSPRGPNVGRWGTSSLCSRFSFLPNGISACETRTAIKIVSTGNEPRTSVRDTATRIARTEIVLETTCFMPRRFILRDVVVWFSENGFGKLSRPSETVWRKQLNGTRLWTVVNFITIGVYFCRCRHSDSRELLSDNIVTHRIGHGFSFEFIELSFSPDRDKEEI